MAEQQYRHPHPGVQFLQLIGLFVGCNLLGGFIAIGIIAAGFGMGTVYDILSMAHTTAPGFLPAFRILIGLGGSLLGILAPALIFCYLVVQEPEDYIGIKNYVPVVLLVLAAVIMVSFLPTVDITAYFNQKMTFPHALDGLYKWIRNREDDAAAQFKVFLVMKSPADLIINLFLIALFPAVSEEFFFRGCMLPIFKRWTQNTHAAVWITAIIFSAIHMEFFGFVPRMLLGAALGYLFAWSGSIWPSVVVHFVNNGFSVVAVYLYQHKVIAGDPDNGDPMFSQSWMYIISFIITILLLLLFHKITVDKQLLIADGEELDKDIYIN